jgi:hypothetical protein
MAYVNLLAISFQKEQVVIAVSRSSLGGGHIGIGFHSVRNGPQVLHLEWHRKLRAHAIPIELSTCWIASPLGIPTGASKAIVALARAVATRGSTINYGINFIAAKGSFDPHGSYKPPKGSDGLTCATFVVELLRAGKIDLVNSADWKAHADNTDWANLVCTSLAHTPGIEQAHVDAVRRNINGLRMRPFEVAGAANLGSNSWPADFDEVQEPAQQVAKQLDSVCITDPLVV